MKELRLFNGRGYILRKYKDLFWSSLENGDVHHAHGYVAAYSVADMQRLVWEYTGHKPPRSEIDNYWSKDAWGTRMQNIKPERGIWVSIGHGLPICVFKKDSTQIAAQQTSVMLDGKQ